MTLLSVINTMKAAVYVKFDKHRADPRFSKMLKSLSEKGIEHYDIYTRADIQMDTDVVLSVGGDGTFLSAAKRVGDTGIPVLGVNLGHLGFLSENSPEDIADALVSGSYVTEDRALLETRVSGSGASQMGDFYPYSLNEVSVHRVGAAMLGVDVTVDGDPIPTYWADGLLIATSSGSTAYSLSVGGPICMPDSRVLVIAPIAPHNLNLRPLVVPDNVSISISVRSRDANVMVTMDNRNFTVGNDLKLSVSLAQFSLKRFRLGKTNFIKALTTKLFWGEDVRNGDGQ